MGEPREFWAERWQTNHTPWDMGQEHPLLTKLLGVAKVEGRLDDSARIMVPGCGRAHDGAAMARRGYRVDCTDLIDGAIKEALKLYSSLTNFTAYSTDALTTSAKEEGAYDAIFDRAMLCALQPGNRKTYVTECARKLRSGGLFMGILFADVDREKGPPFALTTEDVFNLFSPLYTLVSLETVKSDNDIIREEHVCVWRKK
ncbi:MAG: methyltransferase domain-containing protein [Oligoflexales bacterium]